MHLVFVDDSCQPQPRRKGMGELVAIGAVLVPEVAVKPYATELSRLKTRLGIPGNEEIKWKAPKGSALANAGGEVVAELRRGMLTAAAAYGIRSAVVVWDRGHVNWPKETVQPEILKYLYERIEMFLAGKSDTGVVIADKPSGGQREDSKWMADALELTDYGTRYVKADRVIMPIVTAPSHHLPHLQLADLVTAATTAAIAGFPKGLELVDLLKLLAHTNARGYVGGAGVVLWPPDLRDLFYWVFGEEVYIRNNAECRLGPTRDPFVAPGRTYQSGDGMD